MLTITATAYDQLSRLLISRSADNFMLSLKVIGRRATGFEYEFGLIREQHTGESDLVVEFNGLKVCIDPESTRFLQGSTIDYSDSAFKINNPNPVWEDELSQQVADVIDEQINPVVALHGGLVSLVRVEGHIAYISMSGCCQGCDKAEVTLQQGIISTLVDKIPGIHHVVDLTKHENGLCPYYRKPQS